MAQGKLSAILSAILATITGTLLDGMYHRHNIGIRG
jgi:hypothetical protein